MGSHARTYHSRLGICITILFHVTAGLEFIRLQTALKACCKFHLMYCLHIGKQKRLSAEIKDFTLSLILAERGSLAPCMPHKLSATLLYHFHFQIFILPYHHLSTTLHKPHQIVISASTSRIHIFTSCHGLSNPFMQSGHDLAVGRNELTCLVHRFPPG